MDKLQAQQIIKETFENPFDKARFTHFVKNLLNNIEDAPFTGRYLPENFLEYIQSYERVGKFNDGENELDILIITLRKETSLERARTMQRNFVARYLNGSRGGKMKDAALAAFVSPDQKDWRFSLIKMDYKFETTPAGKIKVKEKFTPARRWSFLVGANEKSHTAQSRLVNMLADDEHSPGLAELEKVFDIETVTREFFLKYRELFLRTKAALDQVVAADRNIQADFQAKGVDTVNFAKKLLGQIVFLYFLQKKGWFGVAKDGNWGSGAQHFLRELFDGTHCRYQNFFNDILEPLFYEALRLDRGHDDNYYSAFGCKIPFLNGGLFDPIGNYDWVNTDLKLPNDLFSNSCETQEGDVGNGILDVFDRYNFTVREDEPLEKEVAIDPELLGKTYEKFNAIRSDNFDEFTEALQSGIKGAENKFNKKFGVYYTPREIVHYMCQQSLIDYLATQAAQASLSERLTRRDLEDLIEVGEMIVEYEATALVKQANIQAGLQESTVYPELLPESIRANAALIDRWLAEITVCDPAVGSGAFPVGMMNEIVRARNVLSVFLGDPKRNNYEFKRRCIEHSLYGADIDAGAAEIAKLRLWLSLVVDEEDIKKIKPLPNLDYKIACGNSLQKVEIDLFNQQLFKDLEGLKELFLNETNPSQKLELKAQIDGLIHQLSQGHTEFDFKLYFSEVFHRKDGFDTVIGNPPYIQLQKDGGSLADMFAKYGYVTYERTGDIYSLFYEKGVNILRPAGLLCFITSNKWMRAGYGKSTRSFFCKHQPLRLIDLGSGVFDSATVDTNILLLQKTTQKPAACAAQALDLTQEKEIGSFAKFKNRWTVLTNLTSDSWTIASPPEQKLKEKIESAGKPLKEWDIQIYRGVLTGYNEAFIIDGAKKAEILSRCRDQAELERTKKLLKPVLRGRDIKRYQADFADLWLIYIPWHFPLHLEPGIQGVSLDAEMKFQKEYPVIYNYLLGHKDKLSARNKSETNIRYEWYALQRYAANYHQEFEKEKIVFKEMVQYSEFLFDEGNYFCLDTGRIITGSNLKFLTAILNSNLFFFAVKNFYGGGGLGETGIRMKHTFFNNFFVPQISPAEQQPFITLVEKIIALKEQGKDPTVLESQIERMVYQLYGLTEAEIALVEGSG